MDFLSLGNEGLSFIEIERGGGRRCVCVVRSSAAGMVWMIKKSIRLPEQQRRIKLHAKRKFL